MMTNVYHIHLKSLSVAFMLEGDLQRLEIEYQSWSHIPGLFCATMTEAQAQEIGAQPYIKEMVLEVPFEKSSRNLTAAQWALDRIDQRSGILDNKFTATPLGTGVRVFVVDSGVRMDHDEISQRMALDPYHWDFERSEDDPRYGWHTGQDNHGTSVASIIAGRTLGVAPRAIIHSIRVCDHGTTVYPSNIIAGLNKVLEIRSLFPDDPAIVNISLNGLGRFSLFDNVIGQLTAQGIVVVVSAGNNSGLAYDYWPASSGILRLPSGSYQITNSRKPIVVGGTGEPVFLGDGFSDTYWPQSNYGQAVDLWAPGVNVLTAGVQDRTQRVTQSGTSFSAAFVAGISALYFEREPNLTHHEMRMKLRDRATRGSIRSLPTAETSNNLLANTFWLNTNLKWVSGNSDFKFHARELQITRHEIIAVSNIGQDCETIEYSVSPLRAKAGETLPSNVRLSHTIERVNGAHPYEFTTKLILFLDCKEIQFSQVVEADVTVSDGRATPLMKTISITLENVGKSPLWTSHVDKEVFLTVQQGDVIDPIRFAAQDPDGFVVKYSLLAGQLPKGLSFDGQDISGTVGILDKNISRYELIMRAISATGEYSDITVYIDAPVLNQSHNWTLSWLQGFQQEIFEEGSPTEFTSVKLGDVTKGVPFNIFLEFDNIDNDKLSIQTLGIGDFQPKDNLLPQGIKILDGKIIGVASLNNPPGNYFFRLKASDRVNSGIPPTENTIFHIAVHDSNEVNTAPTDYVIWITPEGPLGSVYETQRSHFAVKARTPGRGQIQYSLAPASQPLPEGMVLDRDTGEIRGLAPFFVNTGDYFFTVRARVGNVISDRSFSITVLNRYYLEEYGEGKKDAVMEIIGDLGGINRGQLTQWVTTLATVGDDLIFRPNDTQWGRVRIPKLYIVNGLKAHSTLESENSKFVMEHLKDYHIAMKLRFGTMNWAKANDPDGRYLYDVIYFNIEDPMYEAGGWDNDDNELVINYDLPPLEIPQWNLNQGNSRYFPNSLMNIRRDLIITDESKRTEWSREVDDVKIIEEEANKRGIGLAGEEGLPLWMLTEQTPGDPVSIPGYKPAVEILYCQPGRGARVLAHLQAAGLNQKFQGMLFTIDRYLINGYGIERDGELFSSSGGIPTEFEQGSGFDIGMVYEYPMYFDVRSNVSTGFVLDTVPAVVNRMVKIEILRNSVLTQTHNVRIENGRFVVDDALLQGDVVIMTVTTTGRETELDDTLNLGSTALTDNGKYYMFPSSNGRKS